MHFFACADVSGLAALQLNEDLGFSEAIYGLGASIFFVGYSLFQVGGVSGMSAQGHADCSGPGRQQPLRACTQWPSNQLIFCANLRSADENAACSKLAPTHVGM